MSIDEAAATIASFSEQDDTHEPRQCQGGDQGRSRGSKPPQQHQSEQSEDSEKPDGAKRPVPMLFHRRVRHPGQPDSLGGRAPGEICGDDGE